MKNFENTWNNLGHRIAEIRHFKGLSQFRLAEMADISKEHLSNLERGKKQPSAKVLIQISNALEISLDDLIGVNHPKIDIEIDKQLQILLCHYSMEEKETLFKNICDIEHFAVIAKIK